MNKNLPKEVYVRWEDIGDGNKPYAPYLAASEDWESHGELGEKRVVGTYQLVEVNFVVSETKKLPKTPSRPKTR